MNMNIASPSQGHRERNLSSGGFKLRVTHLPLVASSVIFAYVTARVHQMIIQQSGTVTHSRISSLLISRRLARPKVTSSSVRTFSVTKSGRGNPKIFGCASRASGRPPFLNPPQLSCAKRAKIFQLIIFCSRRGQLINGVGSMCVFTRTSVFVCTNRENITDYSTQAVTH